MKKLLAVVLCVMMFVAVIPTAAFAEDATYSSWPDKAVSKTAIKDAEKSIKNMYTAIATDEFVFGSVKSMYDFSNSLAEQIFADVSSLDAYPTNGNPNRFAKTYHDDLVKRTRQAMNGILGDTIAEYISARTSVFEDDSINGGVDPEKYLKVYVDALNEALTSEKAQKAIQAYAYNMAVIKTMSAVKDEAEDIQTAIKDWGTSKWDEFGDNFDALDKHVYGGNAVTGRFNAWQADAAMTNPWAYTTEAFGTTRDDNNFDVASIWGGLTGVETNYALS